MFILPMDVFSAYRFFGFPCCIRQHRSDERSMRLVQEVVAFIGLSWMKIYPSPASCRAWIGRHPSPTTHHPSLRCTRRLQLGAFGQTVYRAGGLGVLEL